MKKFVALFTVICMISLCLLPVSASAEEKENPVKLSKLGEEERAEFLSSMNIVVPEELKDIDLLAMISKLEENPDAPCVISYTKAAELFEDVRAAVKKYYGIQDNAVVRGYSARYALQYSTVYSWNTSMENYNCYAYALGRSSACNPGDFSDQQYNHNDSIFNVAIVVKDDLNGDLGYDCVKMQNSRPTSSSGWTNAIAVRKDTTADVGFNDYHFAKLSSSSWLHKPGDTAVLKFNSAPTNSVAWTNEAYDGSIYYSPSIWYESNIIYLLYKRNHGNTTYEWTGNHYHSGSYHYYEYTYTCQDCGDVTETVLVKEPCSGPPCAVHMKISNSLETE
uniref:hypothetical protein n=1 Tax=Agathobacter sp. TaxID=2021311 RepID=UPI004055C9D7